MTDSNRPENDAPAEKATPPEAPVAPEAPARPPKRGSGKQFAVIVDEKLRVPSGTQTAFDAYFMVDWSAASEPASGADSVWWALLRWTEGQAFIESGNCTRRSEWAALTEDRLRSDLASSRVLVGFDFPFGFPRGFAAAIGHQGSPRDAWSTVWNRLARDVTDDDANTNNRFAVAAALNLEVSGAFGPFYGRPSTRSDVILRTLSQKQEGVFPYPLVAKSGDRLARVRAADRLASGVSTPWFVFGGANSVGGQSLVGIPRVAALRKALPDARIWPFETGARLPSREEARVVLAEIYPSMFHRRSYATTEVHDRLQVLAASRAFAAADVAGELTGMFEAAPNDEAALHEEGWILGVR